MYNLFCDILPKSCLKKEKSIYNINRYSEKIVKKHYNTKYKQLKKDTYINIRIRPNCRNDLRK